MVVDRVAGAPLSWGVCEVPGWGEQLSPDRVLTEMREVGLKAPEFGPAGLLPDDPRDKAEVLRSYQLAVVVGVVLGWRLVRSHDGRTSSDPVLESFTAAGA